MRNRSGRISVLLCVLALVLGVCVPPAGAAPDTTDEGAPASLRKALDEALGQYNDAKGRLDASKQRQSELTEQERATETRLEELSAEASTISAAAYRGARMSPMSALFGSESPEAFLDGMATLRYVVGRDDRLLRELKVTRQEQAERQRAIAEEIASQEAQVEVMDRQKKAAETALRNAGGGGSGGGVAAGQGSATPAPRNADGSWPKESCSVNDPTTSGCLTPRTLHAYNEARAAGFTRYTSCYRSGGSGEHPKGRACDFAPTTAGFVDARPNAADKAYGDRLASWLLGNADRLGVMYVIWYKQIWFPGSGWRSYSGDGTPAGDHYNHVHLSML